MKRDIRIVCADNSEMNYANYELADYSLYNWVLSILANESPAPDSERLVCTPRVR